jgi:hypothetical protein
MVHGYEVRPWLFVNVHRDVVRVGAEDEPELTFADHQRQIQRRQRWNDREERLRYGRPG